MSRGIIINRKWRRVVTVITALSCVIVWLVINPKSYEQIFSQTDAVNSQFIESDGASQDDATTYTYSDAAKVVDYTAEAVSEAKPGAKTALEVLAKIEIKGRAPKTGYKRGEFYTTWPTVDGCSLRQRIIRRELGESAVLDGCNVIKGEYDEPYTGEHLVLNNKTEISSQVQIDHVVALSDAWQKGAQYMSAGVRYNIATDPLNLLAVEARVNQKKSDGDAATWLPPNKKFRCQYVARQVSVKYKYSLWMTEAERDTISQVLANCPNEPSVGV